MIRMRLIRQAVIYFLLALTAFLSIFPFLWMVIGATNTSVDIIKGKVFFGAALVDNYLKFIQTFDIGLLFWNTGKIAIVGTILTLLVSSMAGYGFEIFRSRFRERIYQGLLLTMMIPFAAMMIPLFILMATFDLVDSHMAVILPTVASVYLIFYFRQSSKAFPADLRDAARVDGLKEWKIFLFVYVPVMRSTYAAAFIIAFMTAWNSYLWPLIILQSNEQKTFTLALSSLGSAYAPDFGVIMLAAILATLPTLIVFFAMQKQFVQGMLGSVK
ncbi:lactose ABC transporter permease [Superficieibacter electus]|uniref:Lactose ABC transporter permease n=1 Tax=Superficieibacter electus TaxID=2022662 RepID=A0A2P5GLM2_9ENTR|nr:carbohydrate ABC transporter permease [Superficieibacter electus]POP43821.1 lactose ABC transporter permease [Superficieibacter electus]POP46125.1 lactose ABC transporter permease [Superficieibacter electus]